VYDESVDVRSLSMLFTGSKRIWTYSGIDKTIKQIIIRDNRVLVSFNPTPGCEYTRFQRGIHVFPIEIWVPEGCPSSMQRAPAENPYLKIRYKIVFTMDLVVGDDVLSKDYPTVYNQKDLNMFGDDVASGIPMSVSKSPMGAGGAISATINTMRRGYAQWEDILLNLDINNQSNRKIKYVDVRLEMIATEGKTKPVIRSGVSVHQWHRLLFPYAYAKNRVVNTLIVPLSDVRTILPQSFKDVVNNTEIEYDLVVTLDVPLAKDIVVRLPLKILVSSPLRSLKVIDPILMIPSHRAENWDVTETMNWVKYKLCQPWLASKFEKFGLSGSDLLLATPASMSDFVYNVIGDSVECPVEAKGAALQEILNLYRRFTLPMRLLSALSLRDYIPVFEREEIQADDLYSLTELSLSGKIPIGPRVRILAAIQTLARGGMSAEIALMNTGRMPLC
jgi:hypothetical protein